VIRKTLPAAALAVALAACTAPATGTWSDQAPEATASTPPSSSVNWRDCQSEAEEIAGSPLSGAKAECGDLTVPQDWAKEDGPTFTLSLMRIGKSGSRPKIGSLLVNPGGPGASGVELAAYTALFLPAEVRQRFDVVGFDPRGVGRSTQVDCISDEDKDTVIAADPDPVSQSDFDEQVSLARAIGAGCAAEHGAALGLFNTEQTARDMDAIRAAVGDPKLTYLGYSYGTLLGAVYAQLFPTKIRALVLDGAVDPRQDDAAASEGQAVGFEKAFDNFAADCRRRGAGCPLGPDARAAVTQLLALPPVPGRGAEKRSATSGHTLYAVVAALYSKEQWTTLAKALGDLRRGDPTGVFALSDQYNNRDPRGRYDNQIDANSAINCADEEQPETLARIRQLQSSWRAKYPIFGAPLAMSLMSCAVWPAKHDPYPTGAAVGAPPIVVVGTTGDPATPYENTAKLARMLGSGVVVTWQGEGHTAYPQTTCVRNAVNNYLIDLRVPGDGTTCPAR
jgi:pimeloyl-ACP methyl ester carboxylesterase